jgi:hypothetical protein
MSAHDQQSGAKRLKTGTDWSDDSTPPPAHASTLSKVSPSSLPYKVSTPERVKSKFIASELKLKKPGCKCAKQLKKILLAEQGGGGSTLDDADTTRVTNLFWFCALFRQTSGRE